MSLRDTINNNSAVVTIGAVALLMIALGVMYLTRGGGTTRSTTVGQWFYDVQAEQFYKAEFHTLSPDTAPSGGQGLQAFVITCDPDLANTNLEGMSIEQVTEQGMFVAYFERLTDRGRRQIEEQRRQSPGMDMTLLLDEMDSVEREFRTVNNETWRSHEHPSFGELHRRLRERCTDRPTFVRVLPRR